MIGLVWYCGVNKFTGFQGYTVEHSKLYHDSNSSILMENNEIASSSKLTKHVTAPFFNKGSY